ncbi:hypothetical protein FMO003_26000 [Moritella sp. F3]|nr:hypothetical protein FMO001_19270 [Moritella sp. F1]GIC82319.1 hypothetical protein FMO003_26000 [Moritella sp. F3]
MKLSQQDAVEWLKSLADSSVDLLITDLPYESLEKHRKIGSTTRLKQSKGSSNNWFSIFPNERFVELFAEVYRVLKPNSHFYFMCDQETMFHAKPVGEDAGFKFWKPLVWNKEVLGMGYHFRAQYEFVLFFEKGKRKLNNLGIPDVLSFKRVHRGYPTEKPVGLFETLIEQSSAEGDIVADPFFGSGASLVAAKRLNRQAWGNDLSTDAHDHLSTRNEEWQSVQVLQPDGKEDDVILPPTALDTYSTSKFVDPALVRLLKFDCVVSSDGKSICTIERKITYKLKVELKAGTELVATNTDSGICFYLKSDYVEYEAAQIKTVNDRNATKEQDDKQQTMKLEAEARTFNDLLNIPVEWSTASKIVLSGLSSNGNGDGVNKRSVNHIHLHEKLIKGRLKREGGDLLCTPNRGSFDLTVSNGSSKVTCSKCLELAKRWG